MDKQFLHDKKQLSQLIDLVSDFARSFRSGNRWPAGRSLRSVPEAVLPRVGGGAQEAMRNFEEQCTPYLVAAPTARYLGYVVPAPVKPNLITFPLRNKPATEIDRFVQALNDQGRYFLSPTTFFGRRGSAPPSLTGNIAPNGCRRSWPPYTLRCTSSPCTSGPAEKTNPILNFSTTP